ncbi:MAG: hypothetical protein KDB80_02680, partial [Planctomycetes bacterium]|nr:hypothetical protein [Planctomycetota bacterium]
MSKPRIIFLGPQRRQPNLSATLNALQGVELQRGIAVVSAGWEERELEHEELQSHVGVPVRNLEVHGRVEEIYVRDPNLREGMRWRHDRLKTLQELYRLRLEHALAAARAL